MFDVRVDVDGRTVLSGKGKWSGKSAFIPIGDGNNRLTALMSGKLMTIVTASGNTEFRLDGSTAAIRLASRCREQQMAANPRQTPPKAASNGAFAPANTPSNSAFAPPAGSTKQQKLSRADTIVFAQNYLRLRGISADFIAEDANVLRHFPINWRIANGVVGGAMVLRNASATPAAAADQLLAEQRELCKGTVAAINRANAALPGNAGTVELASAQCTSASQNYSIVFQVSTAPDGALVVIAEMAPLTAKPIAGTLAPAADEL